MLEAEEVQPSVELAKSVQLAPAKSADVEAVRKDMVTAAPDGLDSHQTKLPIAFVPSEESKAEDARVGAPTTVS